MHLCKRLCLCSFHRILPRPSAGGVIKDGLAETDVLRRDFHQFVFLDIFQGLLQTQNARRRQPDRLVGRRGPHVRDVLLLAGIDVNVELTGVLSDDPLFFLINSYTTGLSPSVIGYIRG